MAVENPYKDPIKNLEWAKKIAKEKKLWFYSDIIDLGNFGRNYFYDHKFNEDEELESILHTNRVGDKLELRKKWLESDNPTLQMGAMKLLGNNDERKKLSTVYKDITSDGESLNRPQKVEVEFRDFSEDEDNTE